MIGILVLIWIFLIGLALIRSHRHAGTLYYATRAKSLSHEYSIGRFPHVQPCSWAYWLLWVLPFPVLYLMPILCELCFTSHGHPYCLTSSWVISWQVGLLLHRLTRRTDIVGFPFCLLYIDNCIAAFTYFVIWLVRMRNAERETCHKV